MTGGAEVLAAMRAAARLKLPLNLVSILPTTILVDTAGVVRLFHVGYKPGFEKELEEHVKKLLPAK